jgi:hypothetical protein
VDILLLLRGIVTQRFCLLESIAALQNYRNGPGIGFALERHNADPTRFRPQLYELKSLYYTKKYHKRKKGSMV